MSAAAEHLPRGMYMVTAVPGFFFFEAKASAEECSLSPPIMLQGSNADMFHKPRTITILLNEAVQNTVISMTDAYGAFNKPEYQAEQPLVPLTQFYEQLKLQLSAKNENLAQSSTSGRIRNLMAYIDSRVRENIIVNTTHPDECARLRASLDRNIAEYLLHAAAAAHFSNDGVNERRYVSLAYQIGNPTP